MLLITSMVLAACGSLCLGRSLTTLPEKERPKIEQERRIRTKRTEFGRSQSTYRAGRTGGIGTSSTSAKKPGISGGKRRRRMYGRRENKGTSGA